MILDPMTVGLVIFLLCLGGAIFLFYRAIRCFIARNYWSAVMSLLIALLLSHIVLGMLTHPFQNIRERARRVTCNGNLKQIGLVLKIYADNHGGKNPATFNDLAAEFLNAGNLSVFLCPSSGHKAGGLTNIHAWTDYAYVSGLTVADPPGGVVMFCLPHYHQGDGANVTFIDGHVGWVPCHLSTNDHSRYFDEYTFQELTNTPSLFFGTTNEAQLADLKKRTRIIYPHAGGR